MGQCIAAESNRNRYIMTCIVQRHVFDEEYVRRLAGRDEEAERHFTSYFGSLLSIKLRSRLRDKHLIDDVIQETFLRVLRTLGQNGLAESGALGAFVNSVCNNVLFESYRSAARTTPLTIDRESESVDAESALVGGEERAQVREVLGSLSEKHRTILRWIFFEERDKDDVCRELKVDREYLRVLVHRAKESFRSVYVKRDRAAAAGFRSAGGR